MIQINRVITITLLLSLLTVPSLPARAANHQDKTTQDVREVEKRRIQYLTGGDLTQLERILSDDLIYTHSSGRVESKAQFLAALRSGEMKYEAMDHEDVQVRVYGDTAVLTGRSRVKLKSKGEDRSFPLRFTLVYAKQERQWRMVGWQSTRLPEQ